MKMNSKLLYTLALATMLSSSVSFTALAEVKPGPTAQLAQLIASLKKPLETIASYQAQIEEAKAQMLAAQPGSAAYNAASAKLTALNSTVTSYTNIVAPAVAKYNALLAANPELASQNFALLTIPVLIPTGPQPTIKDATWQLVTNPTVPTATPKPPAPVAAPIPPSNSAPTFISPADVTTDAQLAAFQQNYANAQAALAANTSSALSVSLQANVLAAEQAYNEASAALAEHNKQQPPTPMPPGSNNTPPAGGPKATETGPKDSTAATKAGAPLGTGGTGAFACLDKDGKCLGIIPYTNGAQGPLIPAPNSTTPFDSSKYGNQDFKNSLTDNLKKDAAPAKPTPFPPEVKTFTPQVPTGTETMVGCNQNPAGEIQNYYCDLSSGKMQWAPPIESKPPATLLGTLGVVAVNSGLAKQADLDQINKQMQAYWNANKPK